MHDILDASAKVLVETADAPLAIGFNDDDQQKRAAVPCSFPHVNEYPENQQFTIAVVGNAVDKIAQDGDTLLCVRAGAGGAEPQDGDLVVIETCDDADSRILFRRLRQIGDLCEFRPESKDPAFQAAPLICDLRQEEGKINILGKVLFAFRRLGT